MQLKPLFAGIKKADQLQTIRENIEAVMGSLFGSRNLVIDSKIQLLEKAIGIDDPETRKVYMDLVRKWEYGMSQQIEAHEALARIREQVCEVLKGVE